MWLLVPTLALVLLFLLSRSMPWNHSRRWNNNNYNRMPPLLLLQAPPAATQEALALLRHHHAQLLALLHDSTAMDSSPLTSSEFVQQELTVNEHLQHLLQSRPMAPAPAAAEAGAAPASPACRSIAEPPMPRRGSTVGIPYWQSQRRDRYLVLICDSGQVTNHLICLHKHMYMAALLNRTLVLPPGSLDYKYEHLLDIAHLQHCLGNSSIITFTAFEQAGGKNHHRLHIDKLLCFKPDCYFDHEHQAKWEALGFTFGPRENAWATPLQQQHHQAPRRRDAVVARFGTEEAVVAVGDLFYAEVEESEEFTVTMHAALRPHPSIVVAAQRFVQTYLGANFVAVHFRRHGFLVFCNKQMPGSSCFYPIPQAARCIERKVREVGADVVFLSTDAAESEVEALVAVLQHQRGVVVVRRSATHEALAKWDAVLWRQQGREAEAGVMAMVDQAICSLAMAFVGTPGSSFSAHIQSMRVAMATASSCDTHLCDGHGPPSYIAHAP